MINKRYLSPLYFLTFLSVFSQDIEKRTPSALKIKRGTTEKIEVLN